MKRNSEPNKRPFMTGNGYVTYIARMFFLSAGLLILTHMTGCDAALTGAVGDAINSTSTSLIDQAFSSWLAEHTGVPTTTTGPGVYTPSVAVSGTTITLPSTLMPTTSATPTPAPTSTN